jgi:hypothetical protein
MGAPGRQGGDDERGNPHPGFRGVFEVYRVLVGSNQIAPRITSFAARPNPDADSTTRLPSSAEFNIVRFDARMVGVAASRRGWQMDYPRVGGVRLILPRMEVGRSFLLTNRTGDVVLGVRLVRQAMTRITQ